MQWCRRRPDSCDIGEFIGRHRGRGNLGDAAAVDRYFPIRDAYLAVELAGTLTIQTAQFCIRLHQIPCQDRYLHIAFDPDANLKEIRKRNANEGP